jgi:hypothetical protein
LLDLTSITERTILVTGNPFNITVAFWPRYWAQRQRRASTPGLYQVSNFDSLHASPKVDGTRDNSATIRRI